MRIVYGLESTCDLFIRTPACIVFVKTRRTDKIVATIKEIEHACRELIAGLRLFPVSARILPELWIYSKNGTYRFFRIDETGLVELDRDGIPVDHLRMIETPAVTEATPDNEETARPTGQEREGTTPGGLSVMNPGKGIPDLTPCLPVPLSDGQPVIRPGGEENFRRKSLTENFPGDRARGRYAVLEALSLEKEGLNIF